MSISSPQASLSSDDSFGWVDMKGTGSTGANKMSSEEERNSETGEDSDATVFEAGGNKAKENNLKRSDQLTLGQADKGAGSKDTSCNKDSENASPEKSASEDSDNSDTKDLKPFTKRLLVKKEKLSHTLSDGSDVDSPVNESLRVKTEPRSKGRKSAPLIEGVLSDSTQSLAFNIDANEDVWIVQCPYEITESILKGKTLNFNGLSCAEQFEGKLLVANQQPVNLLLPKVPAKLTCITPSGYIIFREKEMAPQIHHPVYSEDNIMSLPAGLKIRHPLFGTDISTVQEVCSPTRRRKKKKKKYDVTDLKNEFDIGSNEVTETKNNRNFSNLHEASPVHDKKKKKKKNLDEQTMSTTSFQDNSFRSHNVQLSSFCPSDTPKIKTEKGKTIFSKIDSNVDDGVQLDVIQKKSKKFKHEPVDAVPQEFLDHQSETECGIHSKKRKHRHLKYATESDKPMTLASSEEMEGEFAQKKKKQKFENESSAFNDTFYTNDKLNESSGCLTGDLSGTSLKKEKHHKYKESIHSEYVEPMTKKSPKGYSAVVLSKSRITENSFTEDIVVDPSIDTSTHVVKKKKKKHKEFDTDVVFNNSVETTEGVNCIPSAKKKKKRKLEDSNEYSEHFSGAVATENIVSEQIPVADFDYFSHNKKKLKKKKKKFEEINDSVC